MDVSVQNVVRTFGATPALHGVSLDVAAGELIALLGPSGSGKTTLLRILAGLDIPNIALGAHSNCWASVHQCPKIPGPECWGPTGTPYVKLCIWAI